MRNSRSNLGFVRILACRLDIICLRHWGTRLVVVLWVRFTKSRSCRPCNDWTRVFSSAVTRSLKMANLRTRNLARDHSPLKSTWILSPKWYLRLCRDHALLPPSTCKQTGRMPPGTKKTLEGRELHGGSRSFLCDPHLLGVTSGLFEAKETSLGNSRPKKNFFKVLPSYGMYSVLCDVTATACDHGYWLN